MGDAPARPKNVPAKAVWVAEDGEWELGPRNPRGEKHGPFKYWRADGTVCNEVTLRHGKPHGAFRRFHNNGEVSQEGTFVDGALHGTRVWHACDEPTDEETLAEGMSRKVRRSEMDYDKGRVVGVRHFDAAGKRVLPDGDPYPDRPPMVPDEAEYQPEAGWVLATLDGEGRRNGTWQRWHDNGEPAERTEYVHNVRHGPAVLFHENGKKAEEGRFEQGEREGVWREWTEEGQLVREVTWQSGGRHGPLVDNSVAGEYADPAITVERGLFEDDHACGLWSLQDARGKTVVRRELGPRLSEERLAASACLADEGRKADAWRLLAEECVEGKRSVEALLAQARAAAVSGTVKDLLEALDGLALPRSPQKAMEIAKDFAGSEVPLGVLVNVLLRGGAPGPLLRTLAVRLDQTGKPRAALDFVNAAILLQPQEGRYLFTRSLVLMSLGLSTLALEDARAREGQAAEEGRFLGNYARVLFPTFDFWAGREKPETYYDSLPERPAQSGGAVRAVVLKYVTRLTALRAAQQAWVKPGAAVPWHLPDLAGLLPAGPVKLDRLTLDRDGEDGPVEIHIDERLQLAGLALPDLQRLARADWTALTWLCWACGLGEIALPRAIAPPADYGAAAGMALQRLWRVRDKRITGGEVAQREEIPGFTWEGMEIDDLHPSLVSMPEAEYAELAAMFRWLSEAGNRSPWQDNLRGS